MSSIESFSNCYTNFESDSCSESGQESSSSNEEEIVYEFVGFDESLEPVATEEEWQAYTNAFEAEQKQQQEFQKRFHMEVEVSYWCRCGHCSVELLVNDKECMCCQEIDPVNEKMADVNMENSCITLHPGFQNVCLERWVLHTAGVGVLTRSRKSYQTLFNQGRKSESEYLRAVSYRQFIRFLWNCLGSSNRTPLPACVYHRIRKEFPSDSGLYKGFEEEGDEEEEESEENEERNDEQALQGES